MKKIGLILLSFMVVAGCTPVQETEEPPEQDSSPVAIQNEFPSKIVYEMDNDTQAMIEDCKERGGSFDECGNGCAESAEICATVCVPVCELDQQPTDDDNVSTTGTNKTDLPLEVPEHFTISTFTDEVSGARVLAGPDQLGNFWVSRTKEGIISSIQVNDQGEVEGVSDIFTGLNNPHGIALDPQNGLLLYIAESDKISAVELYTEGTMETLATLPDGGRHFTRTLHFGPDNRLYVSIGSSCDTCIEENDKRAAIWVMDKNGENFRPYATGLRNAVFLANEPVYGDIWVTEMGRDGLGDNTPPDEINVLQEGADYGWPYCYGDQVRDNSFKEGEKEDYCKQTIAPKVELQAHSAPLGLSFIPEEGWPEDMWLDLVVAYHGSWDRTIPTGYKLVHISLSDEREVEGRQDFITGWLTEQGEKLGRPVDVLTMPGGVMYVTDDMRGAIYKIVYKKGEV